MLVQGLLAAVLAVLPVLGSVQHPFSDKILPSNDALTTAEFSNGTTVTNQPLHLSNIESSTEYTILSHANLPGHRVRVKKSRFCDPTVKCTSKVMPPYLFILTLASVYTGYLDVDDGAKHLFFYFFESRRNPDKGCDVAILFA
jgi:carboxypeptidase C (cathepsin A)